MFNTCRNCNISYQSLQDIVILVRDSLSKFVMIRAVLNNNNSEAATGALFAGFLTLTRACYEKKFVLSYTSTGKPLNVGFILRHFTIEAFIEET